MKSRILLIRSPSEISSPNMLEKVIAEIFQKKEGLFPEAVLVGSGQAKAMIFHR